MSPSDKGKAPPDTGNKPPPPTAGAAKAEGGKSKAELKAERRAKQEAQRAAKAAKNATDSKAAAAAPTAGAASGKKAQNQSAPAKQQGGDQQQGKRSTAAPSDGAAGSGSAVQQQHVEEPTRREKRAMKQLERENMRPGAPAQRQVALFQHLHQYERDWSLTQRIPFASDGVIHPLIIKLGLQYADGVICGSNARCIALLHVLKQVILDYSTPPQKELSRDLEARLKPCISFLTRCRPLSVSMGNAVKYVKMCINNTSRELSETQAKEHLLECIESYLRERIMYAGKAISETFASTKISDGDVIMVYACSSLICRVLCDAHRSGKQFEVIVVDGRPKMEGRLMLQRLTARGIKCTYILINAISYIMKQVSKVLLGAHAVLANGNVVSRVGSSQVALVARAHDRPVLVCAETYKFCERVQTDSFVHNELGDPDDLVSTSPSPAARASNTGCEVEVLHDWRDLPTLSLLNLLLDVTPASDLVTVVITEMGCLPSTSVPVVLRVKGSAGTA